MADGGSKALTPCWTLSCGLGKRSRTSAALGRAPLPPPPTVGGSQATAFGSIAPFLPSHSGGGAPRSPSPITAIWYLDDEPHAPIVVAIGPTAIAAHRAQGGCSFGGGVARRGRCVAPARSWGEEEEPLFVA